MKVKFYLLSSSRSPVEEFLKDQSFEIKTGFVDTVNLLASGQVLSMPLNRNLASIYPGLHEIRLKDKAGKVRVFYFIKKGEAIYMFHAIRKKTQEIQKRDVEIVLKRIREV